MNKELVILTHSTGMDIALLEEKKLVEIHHEKTDSEFNVGDIYLGRIKKVMGGLNAAFIDVGHEKDAFIHYTDLSPEIKTLMKFTGHAIAGQTNGTLEKAELLPEIDKTGNIKDVLGNKNTLLVQVLKEPISTKGPRLTCEITLAGRYVVLSPFTNSVGVSRKIDSIEERKRLKNLIEGFKPKNFGVIVRTVAAGVDAKSLHEDLLTLQERWEELNNNLKGAQPVKKVLSEVGKASGILRDLLNDSFSQIVCNSPTLCKELGKYLEVIAPDKKGIVTKYSGNVPLFDQYGITKQIKAGFGKQVNTGTGVYLIIEKTEACHVIDVNSGNRTTVDGNQENNALKVNLEAAEEIARQLRMRDLGGIIIVDFIDMKDPDNKRELFEKMKEFMDSDRATHTITPLSRFNIMELTRERVRPEVAITTSEVCPTCDGTGKVGSSLLVVDSLQENLNHLMQTQNSVKIFVHPIMAAYLTKGFPSIRMNWIWKYKRRIKIQANENFSLLDYKFFDQHDEEIKLD